MNEININVNDEDVLKLVDHFNSFIEGKSIRNFITEDIARVAVSVAVTAAAKMPSEHSVLVQLIALGAYLAETGKTNITGITAAVLQ